MIKKVYKTELVKNTRKVIKTVEKVIEEEYQEKIAHSRSVYNGATSSGYCLHCKRKLYSSMWKYQGMDDKFLCPDCWYSLSDFKREQYRQMAKRGYYSSETYYTYETRKRNRIIYEEKEVDEEYFSSKTNEVTPKKFNYNNENKIYYNELELLPVLQSKIVNLTNKDISSEKGWYGFRDLDFNLFHFYAKETRKRDRFLWGIKQIPFNEVIISEKQTLEEFCDVVGFYPNVPAFIQGHPLSMYNNKRKNVVGLEKSVTIYVNLSLDSSSDFFQYKKRGEMIYDLIREIRSYNGDDDNLVKVNLVLLDATYINGETIIQRINIYNDDLIRYEDLVYNILTHISFFRVVLLDKKESYIKVNNLCNDWNYGQGFSVSNNDLRNILNLSSTDVLVGSVEECGITSIHEDDDILNFLESIELLDERSIYLINNDVHELSIEQVLKTREIKKLIHVTNADNLESILREGILSIEELENKNINYKFNDYMRLDNQRNAVCLSITDYNNFLFGTYQKRYPDNKYVVLEISPDILLDKGVKKIFCDYNAASKFAQKSETNMEIMFKDKIKRKAIIKTRKGKKKYEPTSYQSEILYCGKIDSKYIMNYYELGKIILK